MKRLIFIYPYVTSYILPILREMAESNRVKIYFVGSHLPNNLGFGEYTKFNHENMEWIELEEFDPFGDTVGQYQKGILKVISKNSPDAVLIWSNPRFISFWAVLIYCHLKGIPVYPRGHGLVKKKRIDLLHRIMYQAILGLSTKYICYTANARNTLMKFVKNENKLVVDNNSLINQQPCNPSKKSGKEDGILYLGRIRDDCGVGVLIDAAAAINMNLERKISLHIIGDGPLSSVVTEAAQKYPWLHYYGKLYDESKINEISRECRFGCVPGFMGLNIVHMFSLSLPVITHGVLYKHGPEAEYIRHLENGFLFDVPNDLIRLKSALYQVWSLSPDEMRKLQYQAFNTYIDLNTPPFFARMLDIMEL